MGNNSIRHRLARFAPRIIPFLPKAERLRRESVKYLNEKVQKTDWPPTGSRTYDVGGTIRSGRDLSSILKQGYADEDYVAFGGLAWAVPALARVHVDRAAGGDRDHRGPDRPAPARGAGGARGGAAVAMRQQPQADGHRDPELRRCQPLAPPGRQRGRPEQHDGLRQRLLDQRADPALPRAIGALQRLQPELRIQHRAERHRIRHEREHV